MDLQVRLSYDTANLLETMKVIYEEQSGVFFSKGDVVSKSLNDYYHLYPAIDWKQYSRKDFNIKNKELTQGA